MFIFYIIFILIILASIKDYRKTIIFYATLRLFFHPSVCLRYESPNITLDFACCAWFLLIYLFKGKCVKMMQIPVSRAYYVICSSYVLSMFTSHYPLTTSIPYMCGIIITLLFSSIFFNEIKSVQGIKFYFKCFFWVVLIFVSFGMYEYVFQFNPLSGYYLSHLPEEFISNKLFTTDQLRYNSIRLQSFANISISYGVICALAIIVISIFYKSLSSLYKKISLIVLPLALLGCVFSGSKTPFIALLSYGGLTLLRGNFSKRIKIVCWCVISLSILIFSAVVVDFYYSIVDSSQSSFEGSDIIMRLSQMYVSFDLLSQSPIWGLGARGVAYAQSLDSDVLGAESIWLQLLLEQGCIGVFAYIYILRILYKYSCREKNVSNRIIFSNIIFMWLAVNTVSSLPGIDLSFFICLYLACFYYMRINLLKMRTSSKIALHSRLFIKSKRKV